MKVAPRDAERFVAGPPGDVRAALMFGPDAGLVRERAETLMKTVVADIADPFTVADLNEDALAADPARLADEAAAISMTGGRRVVRVRGAGNGLAALFARFLADPPGDALVVVEAGNLAAGAALRKLFETAPGAAAIGCYGDTARGLESLVRQALKAEGLSIAPDALAEAVARLGADRGTSRRELEKLALYCRGGQSVSLQDVCAAMGDEAEARTEEAADAAGRGDFTRLDLTLERLWAADTSPVAVVRGTMGHFQRLAQVGAWVARGERLDAAMAKLRPKVHFSRADSFQTQARRWTAARLGEALDTLLEAEILTKTSGVPARAAVGRALMNIAAMARGPA